MLSKVVRSYLRLLLQSAAISILLTLSFLTHSSADTVYLKNGNRLKGIITKETDTSVELKINPGAKVTFSKDDIKNIEKDSDEQHAKLEEEWGVGRNKSEAVSYTHLPSPRDGLLSRMPSSA